MTATLLVGLGFFGWVLFGVVVLGFFWRGEEVAWHKEQELA